MNELLDKLVKNKGYVISGVVLIIFIVIISNGFKTKNEINKNSNQSGNSNLISIDFSDEALFLNPE